MLLPKKQIRLGYAWLGLLVLVSFSSFPYFVDMSQRPTYRIWPLWALAAVLITCKKWSKIWSMPNRYGWVGLVLGIGSIGIGWGSSNEWLQGAGWLCTIIATLFSHQEKSLSRSSLLVVAPCWIVLLRLPTALQELLDGLIWKCIHFYGSWLLSSLGIVCRFSESQVEIRDYEWARSQLMDHSYSFVSIACLSIIWFTWRSHPLLITPAYFVVACIWSLVAVIGQAVTVICWKSFYGDDLIEGNGFHIVGFLSVTLVAILVLSSERMLRIAFYPVPNDRFEYNHRNPILNTWNRLFLHLEFSHRHTRKEQN